MRATAALFFIFGIGVHWKMAHMAYSNCSSAQLQMCAGKFQSISFRVTGDRAQLRSHCTVVKSAVSCVDDYSENCLLSEDQKTLIDKLFSGFRKFFGDLCQEGSQLFEDYLEHSTCMENADHIMLTCMGDTFEQFMGSMSSYTPDKRDAVCCGAEKYYGCMEQVYKAECGPNVARLGKEALDGTVRPVLQFICGNNYVCSSMSYESFLGKRTVPSAPKWTTATSRPILRSNSTTPSQAFLGSPIVTSVPTWIVTTSAPILQHKCMDGGDVCSSSGTLSQSIAILLMPLTLVLKWYSWW